MEKVCGAYNTSSTCTANTAQKCQWDSATQTCGVSNSIIDQQWLRGKVYCPNSLADYMITCSAISSQSSCNANSNCLWQTVVSSGSLVGQFLDTAAIWTGSSITSSTGKCVPKWSNDTSTVSSLIGKVFNASLSSMISGISSSSGAAAYMGPLFTDLYGSCTGVDSFKNLLLACGPRTNKTACEALSGCAWTPKAGSNVNVTLNGTCDIADTFATSLVLNATDPWVSAMNTATSQCATMASSATCTGLATIAVDTAKYTTTFGTITLDFPTFMPGAATAAGVPALLLSVLAAVGVWALLL
ncbi:hypothetical protein GPECTOR_18g64 [Gonium pectorale]|uniref:Uncharacterized protein n=1 Tax=Gonium pectorale TaxID=33097 RepID=A0A150GJZ4_GONPE|nr:hypothetical protein GPECTOR_18g64 [Gonium pectorale]|eukprot:KXZ50087.1 hypothetical protein GPECTOR_18g64 [Gonium pectorale]